MGDKDAIKDQLDIAYLVFSPEFTALRRSDERIEVTHKEDMLRIEASQKELQTRLEKRMDKQDERLESFGEFKIKMVTLAGLFGGISAVVIGPIVRFVVEHVVGK